MNARVAAAAFAASLLAAACGGPNIFSTVKRAEIAECPGVSIGKLVNGYFETTQWTAYAGETETTKLVDASGDVWFAGRGVVATLRFRLDEATGDVTLVHAAIDGETQAPGIAAVIVGAMCDDAR
jgi:hypothetical protein